MEVHREQKQVCRDPCRGIGVTDGGKANGADEQIRHCRTRDQFKHPCRHRRHAISHPLDGIAEHENERKRRIKQTADVKLLPDPREDFRFLGVKEEQSDVFAASTDEDTADRT